MSSSGPGPALRRCVHKIAMATCGIATPMVHGVILKPGIVHSAHESVHGASRVSLNNSFAGASVGTPCRMICDLTGTCSSKVEFCVSVAV